MSSIEEFKKIVSGCFNTLRTTNEGSVDSNAALAIIDAFEKALKAVLEKHAKRGDSWEEAFSTSTCFNVAGAKIKRVEILLEMLSQSKLTPRDVTDPDVIVEEVIEEAADAVAYIAFGMWKIEGL